jgi:hypothetical protein
VRALPDPPTDAPRTLAALNAELDATQKQLEAWRCFHLGIAFGSGAKLGEAIGLLQLSRSLAQQASDLHSARPAMEGVAEGGADAVGARDSALEQMAKLNLMVRIQICLAHAGAVLAGAVLAEADAESHTAKSAAEEDADSSALAATEGEKMLLQRLRTADGGSKEDDYRGTALPFRIFALPPPFEPVPVRPLVFDIALNGIEVPSLAHRASKKPKHVKRKASVKPAPSAASAPTAEEDEFHSAESGEEEEEGAAEGAAEGEGQKGWFSSFWG